MSMRRRVPPAPARRACFFGLLLLFWLAACRGAPGLRVTPAPLATPLPSPTRTALPPTPTRALPSPTPTLTPRPALGEPIRWCLRGAPPQDLARVVDRLNRLLDGRGFHARVELLAIDPLVYLARLAEQPGLGCDLFYLPAGQYAGFVERGLLLPLQSSAGQPGAGLDAQAGGLWASLPQAAWEALRRSGTVYAIPNQGVWVRPPGVSVRADVAAALGLQAGLDGLDSYSGLTPILAKIQQAILDGSLPGLGVTDGERVQRVFGQASLLQPSAAGYDLLFLPFVVGVEDPRARVLNWFRAPEFQELAVLRRQWQEAGYGPEAPLTPDEAAEGYRAGRYVVEIGCPTWPGSALEQAGRYGYLWIDAPLAPPFLAADAPLASLTGLRPALADDPERLRRVFLLLDWLYTDPELMNLLAYGIEDEHWRRLEDQETIRFLVSGLRYQPDFLDQLVSRALLYPVEPQPVGLWESVHQANARAPVSPALGFAFDPRPVAGEAAAIQGILPEWLDPLAQGQAANVERQVDQMLAALESAGLERVQNEVERQFSAWLTAGP
jgi:putative aldouronate transport system substrate-binding protein